VSFSLYDNGGGRKRINPEGVIHNSPEQRPGY